MLLKFLSLGLLLVTAQVCAGEDVTFKNVVARFYSVFINKFNVTIESAKSLSEAVPKKVFDAIEISNSEVPILYKNSISNIEDLDELILENDGITEIQPGAFKNVPQLRKLVIRNNKNLEEIRNGVFNKLNVATLDLSKNSLNKIASGAFDDMPELLTINLADNQLRIWDKNWFANTPLLSRISLQHNLIEEIPSSAFTNLRGEKQFGSVPLTVNIILSNNKIKRIQKDAFQGMNKINNLWLDGNEIDSLDGNLLSSLVLKDLRIDNNKLECLDGDLKNIFVAATTHIDGNPWDCGCLKNIDLWASKHGKDKVIMVYSKMTCDAERIERKLKNLNQMLKELRKNNTEEA